MEKKYIALTFDDGPSADCTPALLDLLEQYSVPASFFVCGRSIDETTAPIMRRAYDMGCEINNHSFSHRHFAELTAEEMAEEVERTSVLIESVVGERPRFFRPPYISVNEQVLAAVDMPFICGIGTEDWLISCSAQRRFDDVMAQVRDGIVILLHDMTGNYRSVQAVGRLIPALLEQGYTFVTVSQLFEAKGADPMNPRHIYSIVPQDEMLYREKWFRSADEHE